MTGDVACDQSPIEIVSAPGSDADIDGHRLAPERLGGLRTRNARKGEEEYRSDGNTGACGRPWHAEPFKFSTAPMGCGARFPSDCRALNRAAPPSSTRWPK